MRDNMGFDTIPALRIGGIEAAIPIIQGGMGVGISLNSLASAVANAGGIGVIATPAIGQFELDWDTHPREANKRALAKEIRKAKAQSNGIIGVNVMVALANFDDLVQCAVDEGADMLLLGAGLPLALPDTLPLENLRELPTKFVPIVSSGRAAKLVFRSWEKRYGHVPDAVVVEGPLAGGHLGFKKEQIDDPEYALEAILPQVLSALKPYADRFGKDIPVIAAGGIFTGADIHRFLELGAAGVQMGTRFVATDECDASQKFKDAYVNCTERDIVIIDSPVGLPGRAIRGDFLDRVSAGHRETFKCPWKCLKTCDFKKTPYCICSALTNAKLGNFDHGFAFAGQNAHKVDRVVPVRELVRTLAQEYATARTQTHTHPTVSTSTE